MTEEPLSPSRRALLAAIGAGTALSAVGGTTAATREADGGQDGEGGDQDGDQGGAAAGSVHDVQALIGPSTNPERPADFFYQPTGLHVQPGDVLRVRFVTPDHNVVSYHPAFGMRRRVPTGVDPISSPLMGFRASSIPGDQIDPPAIPGGGGGGNGGGGDGPGQRGPVPETFLVGLDTPGVYDFLCSPHEHFGMAMRVVVGDRTETRFETSDPGALPEPRAGPVGLARVTLTDPALQPTAILEQGSVPWQALDANQGGGGGGNDGTGENGTDGGTGNGTDGNDADTGE